MANSGGMKMKRKNRGGTQSPPASREARSDLDNILLTFFWSCAAGAVTGSQYKWKCWKRLHKDLGGTRAVQPALRPRQGGNGSEKRCACGDGGPASPLGDL